MYSRKPWYSFVICVLLVSTVLAACGATPTATTAPATAVPATKAPATTAPAATAPKATAPAATTAPTSAPKPTQGDKLVVAVQQWGNENPYGWMWPTSAQMPLWLQIYDPFIDQGADMKLKPGLCTEWSHSADYTVWTFKLRKGVMFHGTWGEMTSADVKFCFEQNLREDSLGADYPVLFAYLDRIETPDNYTVVTYWTKPLWYVDLALATWSTVETITSKKQIETLGEEEAAKQPVGTGPYRFVEGKPGESYTFEAVANHWRVTPGFKTLVVRQIADVSTRLAGLRSGEIDAAQVAGDYIPQAKQAGLRIVDRPEVLQYFVLLPGVTAEGVASYCPTCPWVGDAKDPKSLANALKVRQALNLAINKQAIVDALWQGYGRLEPQSWFYYPNMPGVKKDWVISPYDPTQAKKLLTEAGYPNGFEIKVMAVDQMIDGPDIMEAVAQDWEKIGIKCLRQKGEFRTIVPDVIGCTGDYAWIMGNPWPYASVPLAWLAQFGIGSDWCLHLKGPQWDEDILAIVDELDATKRDSMTVALGQKQYEMYPGVLLGTKSVTFAVSKKVGDWPVPIPSQYQWFYEYAQYSGN